MPSPWPLKDSHNKMTTVTSAPRPGQRCPRIKTTRHITSGGLCSFPSALSCALQPALILLHADLVEATASSPPKQCYIFGEGREMKKEARQEHHCRHRDGLGRTGRQVCQTPPTSRGGPVATSRPASKPTLAAPSFSGPSAGMKGGWGPKFQTLLWEIVWPKPL